MSAESKHVVVLGAGVVGLTTAISILDSTKHSVTILASELPTDPKSIGYTSHWAGAHHVSHATGSGRSAADGNSDSNASEHPQQLAIDKETFNTMWALSEPGSEAEQCFLRLDQVEYYQDEILEGKKHHLSWYPDFRVLPPASLAPDLKSEGIRSGISFTTFTIDVPVYLAYLFARFERSGGKAVKGPHVDHIRDVETQLNKQLKGAAPVTVDAIVNCTGLGSLTLGGVEDSNVYPLRGQTVILHAPWIKFGRTISNGSELWTYVIPRRSGDVVLGGIKVPNDFHPSPRPETTLDILTRGLKLCPEFVPSSSSSSSSNGEPPIMTTTNTNPRPGDTTINGSQSQSKPTTTTTTIDDLIEKVKPIIIGEGCGLRPARRGGLRLEAGSVDINRIDGGGNGHTNSVPLIHNYGHSGSGFQSSWGSAYRAVKLLEEAFS